MARPAGEIIGLLIRYGRIAPCDELRDQKPLALFTKTECCALAVGDFSAGRRHHRVASCDIPLTCRGQAGVDVGAALGDPTKLDRRPQNLPDRPWPVRDEGLSAFVAVRPADGHDPRGRLPRMGARSNRLACARLAVLGDKKPLCTTADEPS